MIVQELLLRKWWQNAKQNLNIYLKNAFAVY